METILAVVILSAANAASVITTVLVLSSSERVADWAATRAVTVIAAVIRAAVVAMSHPMRPNPQSASR
jgi:hypothetical protein